LYFYGAHDSMGIGVTVAEPAMLRSIFDLLITGL
jgi:hypothetical protein